MVKLIGGHATSKNFNYSFRDTSVSLFFIAPALTDAGMG